MTIYSLSQILSMMKDCKLLSTSAPSSSSSIMTSTGLTTGFLQLQYKKLAHATTGSIVIQTKTGSVHKGGKKDTSSGADNNSGFTFQQFLVYMDKISNEIYEFDKYRRKSSQKLMVEEVSEDTELATKKGGGAGSAKHPPYSCLMGIFRKLCDRKGREMDVQNLLTAACVCRSGMLRAAKTAFASTGSALYIDPQVEIPNAEHTSSHKMLQLWNLNAEQV